jgi:hypothetical protein
VRLFLTWQQVIGDEGKRREYDESGASEPGVVDRQRGVYHDSPEGWSAAYFTKDRTTVPLTATNRDLLSDAQRGDTVWLLLVYRVGDIQSYASSQIVDAALLGVGKLHGFVRTASVNCDEADAAETLRALGVEGLVVAGCGLPSMVLFSAAASADGTAAGRRTRVPFMASMATALPPLVTPHLPPRERAQLAEVHRRLLAARAQLDRATAEEAARVAGLSAAAREVEAASPQRAQGARRQRAELADMVAQTEEAARTRKPGDEVARHRRLALEHARMTGDYDAVVSDMEERAARARRRRRVERGEPMLIVAIQLGGFQKGRVQLSVWEVPIVCSAQCGAQCRCFPCTGPCHIAWLQSQAVACMAPTHHRCLAARRFSGFGPPPECVP